MWFKAGFKTCSPANLTMNRCIFNLTLWGGGATVHQTRKKNMNDLFTLPYQKHSETSKNAADQNTTSKNYRDMALGLIQDSGYFGMTADEVDAKINVPTARISTRMKELCDKGYLVCTAMKRKTRSNRDAFVYVAESHWRETMGVAKQKQPKNNDINQVIKDLEYYNKWRSGADIEMPDPNDTTKTINEAIAILKGIRS